MVSTIYRKVQNGNNLWVLSLGEDRNKNSLTIHNNTSGKTLFDDDGIWDSDLLKIARLLNRYDDSRISLGEILKKINKECRHLEIPTYLL